MLSLPAVVVTLLIYRGKQYLDIAAKFAGKEYLIKLVMAVLFLGFAALSAYHLWGQLMSRRIASKGRRSGSIERPL